MRKIEGTILLQPLHKKLAEKDARELYSRSPNDYYAINYRRRIEKIIKVVIPARPRRTLDMGCAQCNTALRLAEKNIFTVGADIDPRMLTYGSMKHEIGPLALVATNAAAPAFKPETFDCVILAEILEHCADPLDILKKVFLLLSTGGIVVITTPNGDSRANALPSYAQAAGQYSLISARQFGPDGDDHLFAFRRSELLSFVEKAGFVVEESEAFGSRFLHLRSLYHLRRLLPWVWNVALEHIVCLIPWLRYKSTDTLFVVARKN